MATGFVVSDLHLFSPRSYGEMILDEFYKRAALSSVVVLNGDTFDFAWTSEPSIQHAIIRAEKFLRDLSTRFSDKQIHYVMGNHDHVRGFIERCKALDVEMPNFHFHPQLLVIGENLFLHGDVCNFEMDQGGLDALRAVYLDLPRCGVLKRIGYKLIVWFRLNRIAYFTHPTERLIKRIKHYLHTLPNLSLHDIRHIYFGHTHVPIAAHSEGNLTFHNTGSTICGLKPLFLEFTLP